MYINVRYKYCYCSHKKRNYHKNLNHPDTQNICCILKFLTVWFYQTIDAEYTVLDLISAHALISTRQFFSEKSKIFLFRLPTIRTLSKVYKCNKEINSTIFGPRQVNLVLIAYASSEGSGEPAHTRSLARTSAARSHTQWESRGTFRQKARFLAPLNGWACPVKICHDGMLEDTNSLDSAHLVCRQTESKWWCWWKLN